ncbi:467_t:CDS:2 [Ambispora gerdemannii]|uniref:467_t:CDS:1 n=1 Tax=Ambispora gerdemannii TaxID=144530 RepID=A0A9N9CT16_9GLOM|nr:467_t:CDS:2 [Ambispora gerdemannii]
MSEKVLCKCGWCLSKDPKGIKITKRTKRQHEQRFEAVELDDNHFVKGFSKKRPRATAQPHGSNNKNTDSAMNVQDITDTDDHELHIEVDSAEFKDDNELHIENEVDCAEIDFTLSIEDDEDTEFWKSPIFFNELPNQNEEELLTDDGWEEFLTNDEQEELLTNNEKGKYK